ncbi:hypothetical protein D3C81_1732500 [compost metagenome]
MRRIALQHFFRQYGVCRPPRGVVELLVVVARLADRGVVDVAIGAGKVRAIDPHFFTFVVVFDPLADPPAPGCFCLLGAAVFVGCQFAFFVHPPRQAWFDLLLGLQGAAETVPAGDGRADLQLRIAGIAVGQQGDDIHGFAMSILDISLQPLLVR